MSKEPWIKIYSEQYEDHLIGNKKGIEVLISSLKKILDGQEKDIPDYLKRDFHGVTILDKEYESTENFEPERLIDKLFGFTVLIWFLVLPILGIVFIAQLLI